MATELAPEIDQAPEPSDAFPIAANSVAKVISIEKERTKRNNRRQQLVHTILFSECSIPEGVFKGKNGSPVKTVARTRENSQLFMYRQSGEEPGTFEVNYQGSATIAATLEMFKPDEPGGRTACPLSFFDTTGYSYEGVTLYDLTKNEAGRDVATFSLPGETGTKLIVPIDNIHGTGVAVPSLEMPKVWEGDYA